MTRRAHSRRRGSLFLVSSSRCFGAHIFRPRPCTAILLQQRRLHGSCLCPAPSGLDTTCSLALSSLAWQVRLRAVAGPVHCKGCSAAAGRPQPPRQAATFVVPATSCLAIYTCVFSATSYAAPFVLPARIPSLRVTRAARMPWRHLIPAACLFASIPISSAVWLFTLPSLVSCATLWVLTRCRHSFSSPSASGRCSTCSFVYTHAPFSSTHRRAGMLVA